MKAIIQRERESDNPSFLIRQMCQSIGDKIVFSGKDGTEYRFSVVHITDDKIYFMSDTTLVAKRYTDTIEYLKSVEENFPTELLDIICETHHKSIDCEYRRKISLPSAKNVDLQGAWVDNCSGEDDVVFDAFNGNYAARCRINIGGFSVSYWTDTSSATNPLYFYNVEHNGMSFSCHTSHQYGVCPCFCVCKI